MAEDSVTLALGGTVPVRGFATAIDRLAKALAQLSADEGARIEWVLSGLDFGSATATTTGRPSDAESEPLVSRVVAGFAEASEAVAYGRPTRRSQRTLQLLQEIADLIGDGIDEVRFETADREVVITATEDGRTRTRAEAAKDRGTVVGRVQTLQGRGQLRFTLYDLTYDRAVACYLQPDQQELMRGAWGHLVEVEGVVSRDPVTNVPLAVRQVTNVQLFPEPDPEGYLTARGAVRAPGSPPGEDVIRRLRDAG